MGVVVSTVGLTKRYGSLSAVDHINLEINRGDFFGLLGPNGAGKTTTIQMLSGLTRPSEGKAIVLGFDIIRETVKVKEKVGVVPETSNLYDDMTAWDNLIFAAELYGVLRRERAERAKDLLELFGLYGRCKEHVSRFSKGMKRRLTIAAALVHEPELLFLDEPTTGLDIQSARMIRKMIQELNREGVTVLLTTHYIEEADLLCDRIAILHQGKTVAIDSPEKLKASVQSIHAVEVSFDKAQGFEDKLRGLSHVSDVLRQGDKFKLYVEEASKVIPSIIDFAKDNHLKIISMNTLEPSLEDAFVKITGLSPEIMTIEKEHPISRGGAGG